MQNVKYLPCMVFILFYIIAVQMHFKNVQYLIISVFFTVQNIQNIMQNFPLAINHSTIIFLLNYQTNDGLTSAP